MGLTKIESPFQMMNHRVEKISIDNKLISLQNTSKGTINKISIDEITIEDDFDGDDKFMGNISLNIDVSCKNESKPKEKITVKITLCGYFVGDKAVDGMDRERFERMLYVNGTTSLYSIARSIITTTTSQCLISGKVVLPMINVLEFLEDSRINE
ncbi:MAG: hypothetical protein LBU94_00570 [Clostridiales bacterium]|jgi:preprotein translocase subunit SecB|nr:hypothetical protein [Clostridiales bacterium]